MGISENFERFYKDVAQFDKHLGMVLTVHAPGQIIYALPIRAQHLASPDTCHGGVVSAMMDAVLGITALSYAVSKGNLCATVEFKINYLSPAKLGDQLEGSGAIDFYGSKLIVTSGQILEKNSGRLVAKGLGTFSQYPFSKKPHNFKHP
jgi:uncharacterized protein (TIGR00369 family)